MKKVMTCKKCGNNKFMFEWRFKNKDDLVRKYLNHDGYGFQFQDSYVACSKCKKFVEYEKEDFISAEEKK